MEIEESAMDEHDCTPIRSGMKVDIVLKADQRSGRLTRGTVQVVLTRSQHHPHGMKVRAD